MSGTSHSQDKMEQCIIKDNNETPTSNTQNMGSSLEASAGKRKNDSWSVTCVPSTDPFELELAMIGFGLDLGVNIVDATESSVRAVQDALSRSCVSIANRSTHPRPWQVLIKLGVPARRPSLREPMHVDLARLKSILPAEVTIMPVVIELGGLSVAGNEISAGRNAACAVVASVTIRRPVSNSRPLLPDLTTLETETTGRQALRQPTVLLTPQLGSSSSMEVLARISEEVWRTNNEGGPNTSFAHGLRNGVESDASAAFSSRIGTLAILPITISNLFSNYTVTTHSKRNLKRTGPREPYLREAILRFQSNFTMYSLKSTGMATAI
jgi:Conserved hypothetical protein (Lin0512_fam)